MVELFNELMSIEVRDKESQQDADNIARHLVRVYFNNDEELFKEFMNRFHQDPQQDVFKLYLEVIK